MDERISVIVPAVGVNDAFRQCLESLDCLAPRPGEVIVVVDGGDRDAESLAARHGARVLSLAERSGPAAARNAGVEAASGRVIFFVDSDVRVAPDALSRVAAVLDDGYEAVIGSYDDRPGRANFLSQYKNLAHHFVHQSSRDEACTFWGACGAVTRDAFERAGGFDETYRRPSIEDIEFGARLVRAGCRIRLEKTLQVTHLKEWRPWTLLRSEVMDRALPWTRLILQAGRMPNDLNLRWSGRAAVSISCLLAFSIVAVLANPATWPLSVALAASLVVVDLPILRFFLARRGPSFAARAAVWQWVHYLCAAVGFCAGALIHVADVVLDRSTIPDRDVASLVREEDSK